MCGASQVSVSLDKMRKNDENDLGEPLQYDPNFDGPLKRRSCTDVLFLAIFIVFIGAWIGIGLYAILHGDLKMLMVPKDTKGRRCGVDIDVSDKPYLLFHDLTKCLRPTVPFTRCPTPQVCVAQCPTELYADNTKPIPKQFCTDDGVCPPWLLPSKPVLNRCLYNVADRKRMKNSDVSKVKGDEILFIKKLLNPVHQWMSLVVQNTLAIFSKDDDVLQLGQNVVEDVVNSWWKMIIGVLFALLAGILYILILRWTAAVMVWISIFGVVAVLAAGVYFTAVNYIKFRNELNDGRVFENDQAELVTRRDLWLTGLVVLSCILTVILLMLIFLRKRISLAIALIKEASKAVSSVTASLFFPIIPWLLQVGVIVYAIVVGIYLSTTGNPLFKANVTEECEKSSGVLLNSVCNQTEFAEKTYDSSNSAIRNSCQNAACVFIRMEDNLYVYLQAYNIVGFFWLAFFVTALGQMVLAGVFARWYWTFNKRTLPFFAVTSAMATTLRYHIGTLAFGSLIITICRLIRVVLEYLDHQLKKYDNALTKAIMCLLKCFFYCLEKFLKFINKNAYIMCAVHGKNFCASAKDAFMLLMRNIVRVWVLDKVTDFLFFLSKILLTVGVGAVAYVFFATDLVPGLIDNSELHYELVPVIIIMICTYLISSLFFSVYSMAVDTLFLCFLEDCERNDGSPEKPYYMSKNLMKIFGKKNKRE